MKFKFVAAFILTPFAAAADIQPLDGSWSGSNVFTGQSGCPAGVAEAMANEDTGYKSKSHDFPVPFDPVPLVNSDIVWTKLAIDQWRGEFMETQVTQLGTLTIKTSFDLMVVAPDRIIQDVRVDLELPAQMAQMAGLTGTNCSVQSTLTHTHDG